MHADEAELSSQNAKGIKAAFCISIARQGSDRCSSSRWHTDSPFRSDIDHAWQLFLTIPHSRMNT